MKPEQLRKALQAKQRSPVVMDQKVETYANAPTGMVYLKFTHASDHLQFNRDQAKSIVTDLIAACKHVGIKIAQELKWG